MGGKIDQQRRIRIQVDDGVVGQLPGALFAARGGVADAFVGVAKDGKACQADGRDDEQGRCDLDPACYARRAFGVAPGRLLRGHSGGVDGDDVFVALWALAGRCGVDQRGDTAQILGDASDAQIFRDVQRRGTQPAQEFLLLFVGEIARAVRDIEFGGLFGDQVAKLFFACAHIHGRSRCRNLRRQRRSAWLTYFLMACGVTPKWPAIS